MKFLVFFLYIMYSLQCFGGADKFELQDSEFKYIYEIEITEDFGDKQDKRGKISIIGANNRVVDLHRSGLLPGCSNNFPAVQIIKLNATNFPLSNKFRPRSFVAFCGNSDGKHNVLSIYQPFKGFVGSLDFLEGPVSLSLDKNGDFRVIVEYRIYIGAIGAPVPYPVFYSLKPIGVSVGFSDENDSYSYENYRQIVDESVKSFQLEQNMSVATRALLVANISGKESLYCATKKALENISGSSNFSNIFKEIELKFNSLSCKGESQCH